MNYFAGGDGVGYNPVWICGGCAAKIKGNGDKLEEENRELRLENVALHGKLEEILKEVKNLKRDLKREIKEELQVEIGKEIGKMKREMFGNMKGDEEKKKREANLIVHSLAEAGEGDGEILKI